MIWMTLIRPRFRQFALSLVILIATVGPVAAERPILITVDDLPIASGSFHPDPEERKAHTRDLLDVLARHEIRAVGFVT